MKRCTMPPTPPTPQLHQYYPYSHLHHHYPTLHHCCDLSISDNSSEVTPTVHSQGDACWAALRPPICTSEARVPELYPIYESPRRRIFGKMAGNPFTKPPAAQSTEPGLSHVARWLDTIRLDDIEKYHEPFPETYEESEENEDILSSDCAGSN
ncbi:hypothetical protein OESDEN_16216 [Oesophagostomum dentatum]|uniref:Uncharacterized protein n=1 Tax=Oesophagostomum dentatum TaxID=61180 RepID=A0A0B1SGN4_OESDE|nr:hypothetical protein OESDEN_16216 [Oesophagostomum dentatum]